MNKWFVAPGVLWHHVFKWRHSTPVTRIIYENPVQIPQFELSSSQAECSIQLLTRSFRFCIDCELWSVTLTLTNKSRCQGCCQYNFKVMAYFNYKFKWSHGRYNTAWSTMTESVGNETIEKYWCFLFRNSHWLNFINLRH
jgi:hypothetical protein